MSDKTKETMDRWRREDERSDKRYGRMMLLPIALLIIGAGMELYLRKWISATADLFVVAAWVYWRRIILSLGKILRERM